MTARVGLIGHPLDHSISPHFQQAAFDALGIDARYDAWDLPPEQLQDFIAGLRRPDALGANVTIPYKEAALRSVDRLHETARFVGAINTIVNEGGRLAGYNTDVAGFQAALKDAGFDPRGANVVIWGAGGAARAVAWALIWRGVNGITVINRTPVRAGRLRHDIAAAITGGKPQGVRLRVNAADHPDALEALRLCDIVVNCTPIGMKPSAAAPDQSGPETPFPRRRPQRRRHRRRSGRQPNRDTTAAAGHHRRAPRPRRPAHARPPRRRLLRALDSSRPAHGHHDQRRQHRHAGPAVTPLTLASAINTGLPTTPPATLHANLHERPSPPTSRPPSPPPPPPLSIVQAERGLGGEAKMKACEATGEARSRVRHE